jgi:hypothetical protein
LVKDSPASDFRHHITLKMLVQRQLRESKKILGRLILYNAVSKTFIVIEPKFLL